MSKSAPLHIYLEQSYFRKALTSTITCRGEILIDCNNSDVVYLQRRVRELEEKVEQLRLSRRVLMNLVEKLEKEKNSFLNRLEKENKRLLHTNYRYARWLLCKNRQIVELESKLQGDSHRNSAN